MSRNIVRRDHFTSAAATISIDDWNSSSTTNAPNQHAFPAVEPIPHDFFERMERSPSSKITPSSKKLLDLNRSLKLPPAVEHFLPSNSNDRNIDSESSPLEVLSPLRRPPVQHSNGSYSLCPSPPAPINNGNNGNNNIRTKEAVTTFSTKKRIDEAIREAIENVNEAMRKSLENFHSSLQTIANESFTSSYSSSFSTKTTSTSAAVGTGNDTYHMQNISSDHTRNTKMRSTISSTSGSGTTTSSSRNKNESQPSSTNANNSKLSISSDAAVNHYHRHLLRPLAI